jgi:hypothetical protein
MVPGAGPGMGLVRSFPTDTGTGPRIPAPVVGTIEGALGSPETVPGSSPKSSSFAASLARSLALPLPGTASPCSPCSL